MCRYKEATYRTVRWLDRCIAQHHKGWEEVCKKNEEILAHNAAMENSEDKQTSESGPAKKDIKLPRNLFPIVQGWLDTEEGGLRDVCIQV